MVKKSSPSKRRLISAKPTAIDLFSGCGGLTLGLKQAGFRVLGAIEMDDFANDTYELNHPEVEIWEDDIRNIHPVALMDEFELQEFDLDLLAGCPPCQGFSTITTLNGKHVFSDERNDLVLQFLHFVEHFLPKSVMLENVPGIANDERFIRVYRGLKKLGYHITWDVLNAADFGVPQRRKRLILVGSLYEPVEFAPIAKVHPTVRDAIGKLPPAGASGDPAHDIGEQRSKHIQMLIERIPKDGGSRSSLPVKYRLKCHRKTNGFKDIYGRMAWDSVAPTITGGCFNPSKGRFLHPEQNRAITMREAALLQGFPHSYKFSSVSNKSALAQLIGNALPPPFIKAHAAKVRSAIL